MSFFFITLFFKRQTNVDFQIASERREKSDFKIYNISMFDIKQSCKLEVDLSDLAKLAF